jgi:hypothetical protein
VNGFWIGLGLFFVAISLSEVATAMAKRLTQPVNVKFDWNPTVKVTHENAADSGSAPKGGE